MLSAGRLDDTSTAAGFLVVALLTAGVVAVLADSSGAMARAAAWTRSVWIGLRSSSIYLWHWPVIMLTRPDVDIPLDGVPLVILRLGLALCWRRVLSYHYVGAVRRPGSWASAPG